MSCEGWFDRLDDYVDGELSGDERAGLDRHLESCPDCRRALQELRGLLAAAADLPGSIPPSRDLWPGARDAIRREQDPAARALPASRPGPRSARWWTRPGAALAAAAALILVSAAVTALLVTGIPGPHPAGGAGRAALPVAPEPDGAIAPEDPAAAGAGILPEMAAAESEYENASRPLLEALRRRSDLPAGALETIERNLRVIDRAIADSRAALARDPYNTRLGQWVAEACQRKLDLLRDVARLTARV